MWDLQHTRVSTTQQFEFTFKTSQFNVLQINYVQKRRRKSFLEPQMVSFKEILIYNDHDLDNKYISNKESCTEFETK